MSKTSRRAAIRARRRRERIRAYLIWGGIGAASLALTLFLIWSVVRPAAGKAVPQMPRGHIASNEKVTYNTDPPTSGPHYSGPLRAGFYEEADLAQMPPFPEGHLVHNLEHGYVIFWYNCALLTEAECAELKDQIRAVMDRFDGQKLIAFPRETLEVPVVLTSWGRMEAMEAFDESAARRFVSRNRNRSPEATAP